MRHAIKSGLSLLLITTALVAAPAMAQDYGYYGPYSDRYDRPPPPPPESQPPPPRVVYRPAYRPAPPPVYGPPRWARGVPYYDRGYGPTYVVHDYYDYGLRPPPRGYYWRRSDAGDFLLVAVATGIITDLILGHR